RLQAEDADAKDRVKAAVALGDLGLAAREAVPALLEALGNDDGDVRLAVTVALRRIGPGAAAASPLAALLKDPDVSVRVEAARALAAIGPKAKGAVPALLTTLHGR